MRSKANPGKRADLLSDQDDLQLLMAEKITHAWGDIPAIKRAAGGKLLVATAGGIRVDVVNDALKAGKINYKIWNVNIVFEPLVGPVIDSLFTFAISSNFSLPSAEHTSGNRFLKCNCR